MFLCEDNAGNGYVCKGAAGIGGEEMKNTHKFFILIAVIAAGLISSYRGDVGLGNLMITTWVIIFAIPSDEDIARAVKGK